ncbi:MAG: hypothetical protein JOS17DRAFT_739598 [Linnemannia elongata]|nr:MAG: hypothetical protein JOS17DRAFT_739598 [Linnemannia elongata]
MVSWNIKGGPCNGTYFHRFFLLVHCYTAKEIVLDFSLYLVMLIQHDKKNEQTLIVLNRAFVFFISCYLLH